MEPGLQMGGREPWKQYNQLGDSWLIQSGSDGGLSEGRAAGTESGGHAWKLLLEAEAAGFDQMWKWVKREVWAAFGFLPFVETLGIEESVILKIVWE